MGATAAVWLPSWGRRKAWNRRRTVPLVPTCRDQTEFLTIGEPRAWQSRNCWDFACHVERELFGRELPHVAVPSDQRQALGARGDRAASGALGLARGAGWPCLVAAADGALVLLAHLRFPAHLRRVLFTAAKRTAFAAKPSWPSSVGLEKVDLLRADFLMHRHRDRGRRRPLSAPAENHSSEKSDQNGMDGRVSCPASQSIERLTRLPP